MKKYSCLIVLLLLTSLALAGGFDKSPVTGDVLTSWKAAQDEPLQAKLETVFPESEGYVVTGPIDPLIEDIPPDIKPIFHSVRVICPDFDSFASSYERLEQSGAFRITRKIRHITKPMKKNLIGYRGILVTVEFDGRTTTIQMQTTNQLRWLLWTHRFLARKDLHVHRPSLAKYAELVADYLYEVDTGYVTADPPAATSYDIPEDLDIYATPPDYVIQGYDNYMNYLYDYRAIHTSFASGVEAFVPSDSLLGVMVAQAPNVGYRNKEREMLQSEYRKFFERGGRVNVMQTLTKQGFDTLQPGEYFFAVGLTGEVRIGRELPRAEVERIEAETGRKLPRANHAFLFPGEPILTAGGFTIDGTGDARRLAAVTAQSGHYFYSNITPTVKEDISKRSDDYLMTLGHFFAALDDMGIPHERVLISKF